MTGILNMNVVTLSAPSLDWQTKELAEKIEKDHPQPFDIVIAIKRGGSYVARSFLKSFPEDKVLFFTEAQVQRPTTKRKKEWVTKGLRRLPLWYLDFLRCIEASLLSIKHSMSKSAIPAISLGDDLASKVRSGKPEVLVIDDAVDSGVTVKAVIDSIKRLNPEARMTTAVITQTTSNPLVKADYFIYNNRTLVRFPWSADYLES